MQAVTAAQKLGAGNPCGNHGMPNGRCRLHGGKSTGPRTREGKARSSQNRLIHGEYSREAIRSAREARSLIDRSRRLLEEIR